eukprot:GEMP01026980.1.p1 GENE.GEMP01026980.1~~GEMP01026980.1.p1  ORF type:complete len:521 (+),score=103.48 GEMP01026980.1:74-1636(+)
MHWYYLDPQRVLQGPYTVDKLQNWAQKGYFKDSLLLSNDDCGPFLPLDFIFPSNSLKVLSPKALLKQAVSTRDLDEWYFRAPDQTIQGPFPNERMHKWLIKEYLNAETLIKIEGISRFLPLGDVFPFFKKDMRGVFQSLQPLSDVDVSASRINNTLATRDTMEFDTVQSDFQSGVDVVREPRPRNREPTLPRSPIEQRSPRSSSCSPDRHDGYGRQDSYDRQPRQDFYDRHPDSKNSKSRLDASRPGKESDDRHYKPHVSTSTSREGHRDTCPSHRREKDEAKAGRSDEIPTIPDIPDNCIDNRQSVLAPSSPTVAPPPIPVIPAVPSRPPTTTTVAATSHPFFATSHSAHTPPLSNNFPQTAPTVPTAARVPEFTSYVAPTCQVPPMLNAAISNLPEFSACGPGVINRAADTPASPMRRNKNKITKTTWATPHGFFTPANDTRCGMHADMGSPMHGTLGHALPRDASFSPALQPPVPHMGKNKNKMTKQPAHTKPRIQRQDTSFGNYGPGMSIADRIGQ